MEGDHIEDEGDENAKLYGADLEVRIAPETRARVEYARSEGEDGVDTA